MIITIEINTNTLDLHGGKYEQHLEDLEKAKKIVLEYKDKREGKGKEDDQINTGARSDVQEKINLKKKIKEEVLLIINEKAKSQAHCPVSDIYSELEKKGITEEIIIENVIAELKQQGIIFEPNPGVFRTVA